MDLRVGVIGTGAIGQEHINRLNNKLADATVVAMTDINISAAQSIAAVNPGIRILKTGQEVINDPAVDAVVVTSWGPSHEAYVLASIAAGKPVFCEKPLAVTADGALRIVQAELDHGKRLVQVGFMRRYDAGYRALKQIIDSGKIGSPLMLHCAHRNPTVPETYITSMAITDTAIHEIDVLHWLIDEEYVSAQVIMAKETRKTHSRLKDPQLVILTTATGIRIIVEVFVNCQYGYDIQCEVVGETGIARLPEPSAVVLRSGAQLSTEILTDWKQRFIDAYDVELQDWIQAVMTGKYRGPSAWDGYLAAVAADACVQSQSNGQVVPIVTMKRPGFYDN